MTSSNEIKLDIKLYDEVWSAMDFNPDRITSEMKKLFIYNETETKKHNHMDQYFYFNTASANLSPSLGNVSTCGPPFCSGVQNGSSDSLSDHLSRTMQSIFSLTEIQHLFNKVSIEIAWTGGKFIPKSFSVYRLTDITDLLQVDIFNKQLKAEQKSGATIRRINTRSKSLSTSERYSCPLVGEIKLYLGKASCLPCTWMFCHGQALSRIHYQLLFSVIGELFGAGDRKTTFNVPDFRGQSPGISTGQTRIGLSYNGTHSQSIAGSTASTENGQPFNNMPPYQTINYIIFTGFCDTHDMKRNATHTVASISTYHVNNELTLLKPAPVLSATKLKVEPSSTTLKSTVKYTPKTSMLHSTKGVSAAPLHQNMLKGAEKVLRCRDGVEKVPRC
ncbi:unnamed protein product [Rotaria sp. Silwood2]|nr:unnamed protein product [Rotaria sp. Silwood2]CAF3018917.1 unnamed protein product [Rotaria sp. Silwood2]CAF3372799.1 unnamed protein product [Rotaria sp. Silwood2]CAF4135216.1 unnamed protein product [Rotaria sp. Silwood2]